MGGSGGGGSSGNVTHAAYLEAVHASWLDHAGADTISDSVTDVMNSALGNSPWTVLSAYNPDAAIAAYEAELAAFKVLLSGLLETTDWETLYNKADTVLAGVAEAAIIADAAAFGSILDSDMNTKILPRFRRGMQDINAVVSSAFVLGQSVIEGFRDREIAKYTSQLRLDINSKKITAVDQMIQMMSRRIAWNESLTRMTVESNRIKIVAKKEESDLNATYDEEDGKWDLEVFQYGANAMAAISGGVAGAKLKPPSQLQSAIGGGMMGAAAGGMIGGAIAGGETGSMAGPYGAAIGAVLGAAMGMLSSN